MDSEGLAKAKAAALEHFGDIEDHPQKVKSTGLEGAVKVEAVRTILERNYNRRSYVVSSIRDFAFKLSEQDAFVVSRLLPKEVVESLTSDRNGGAFADKIINCGLKIVEAKELSADLAKRLEERFLTGTNFRMLLSLIGRLD